MLICVILKLQGGFNCLIYNDLNDRINEALNMDFKEINELRKNVKDYYNSYLTIDAVCSNLISSRKSIQQKCFLNAEYYSVKEIQS
jgi:hypothetical protein